MALGFDVGLVDCRPVCLGRLGGPVKTAEQVGADGGQQVVAGQLAAGGQVVRYGEACHGPSAIPTATARFSSTTGDGASAARPRRAGRSRPSRYPQAGRRVRATLAVGIDVVSCADRQQAIQLAAVHPAARYHATEVRSFQDG